MYRFDPLMLAAQGYQESRLNQNAKSHVGAIGIMQVMPATGAELKVGDIRIAEANVHAGTKYMDQLMSRYFGDAQFDETNRTLFAFASLQLRPRQHRSACARRRPSDGLDDNSGSTTSRLVTAEKIGVETDHLRAQHLQVLRRLQADDRPAQVQLKAREGVQQGK